MKKFIYFISLTLIFLFVGTIYCYSYFDLLVQKNSISMPIGIWENNNAFYYLNNKKPSMINNEGEKITITKNIAELIWTDIKYNENNNIISGNLRTEYINYEFKDIVNAIDKINEYFTSFLKINENGLIYYPEYNKVDSFNINFNKTLLAGEYQDYLNFILTADITNAYYAPITFIVTLEADSDISDFALELLYTPPQNAPNMFTYEYRIIDNNLNNPTICNNKIDKKNNDLLLIKSNYEYDIHAIKYFDKKFETETISHYSKIADFGSFSRFITGSNLAIGKTKKNKYKINEQILIESNPKTSKGLYIIGKPNGNLVELRLSIMDKGEWNKPSFDIIPIIIRISRGISSYEKNNIVIPKITIKAIKGDVW